MGTNARSDDGEDLFNQVLSGSANIHEGLGGIGDIFLVKNTVHAADAIDFEDEDELADDEEEEEVQRQQQIKSQTDDTEVAAQQDADDMFDDVFGDGESQPVGGSTTMATNESELQQQADADFDDMFGDAPVDPSSTLPNDNLFGELLNGLQDDDGLDLGFFNDDTNVAPITTTNSATNITTIPPESSNRDALETEARKRKLEQDEKRAAKKRQLQKIVAKMEKKQNKRYLAKYFPSFSQDKPYNNHLLFLPSARYFNYLRAPVALKLNVKPLLPTKVTLELDVDQRRVFKGKPTKKIENNNSASLKSKVVDILPADFHHIKELQERSEQLNPNYKQIPFLSLDGSNDVFKDIPKDLVFSTTSWDDDAIINAGGSEDLSDGDEPKTPSPTIASTTTSKVESKPAAFKKVPLTLVDDYNSEDDEQIFNGQIANTALTLNMNDPNLLLVPDKTDINRANTKAIVPISEKLMERKFNISNDNEYEVLKKNYNTKVRSQLSNLTIDHSIPAMRLQSPYYKVKLTKQEARGYHRPKFQIRPGALMTFSKIRLRKKKKDRGKTSHEIFQKTSDLSITDSGTIIGMEYAEQYPQIMSGFGMGSKIINYYRKEREDDYARPKAPLGETHVLGVEDRSPFWNFGHVAKGDFVPTLYNNMVRAPIFKHDVKGTDFLLVRSQGSGSHQRHYLRNINHLFAVGQLFPAVEVPAPHSRKITNTSKNRLKIIVYRTMNKNSEQRISVKDISHHFPDQNDMQNRQRLKEFMEYQRHGDDQGFWKMKNNEHVPNEEEIRTMITPEDLCLLDSMQHGQQMLEDFVNIYRSPEKDQKVKEEKKEREAKEGSKDGKEGSVPKDDDLNGGGDEKTKKERKRRDDKERDMEDIEEELCSWNTSRNFLNANQTKANLQLNGEGDPTGIGLGFSLLRATQKSTFAPLFAKDTEGPKTNTAAQSQKIYEDEVSRIWYAQRRSLTVDNNAGHDLDSVYQEYKPVKPSKSIINDFADEKSILKITRRFRDENNIVQRRVTTIRDPILIRAYTKRKKQIEDDLLRNAEVDDIIPTNDKELNRLRRKALEEKLANLEKRAKLGKGRKISKDALHAAAAAGGTIIDANTVMLPDGSYAIGGKGIGKGKSRTRRCAACGALGHIRTRKTCPLFNKEKNQPAPPIAAEKAAAAAAALAAAAPDQGNSESANQTPSQSTNQASPPVPPLL